MSVTTFVVHASRSWPDSRGDPSPPERGMGIKTTSFVAVIGTVTLAFSLAMQNTLSNFAGGTLILLLKPFKVGDYISTSSGEGTVESIGLVYTTLLTTDNRVITIPNSSVSSAPLTNLTRTGKRRLIINVGIGYSSDLLKAKNVLKQIFEENPYIMKDQDIQVIVVGPPIMIRFVVLAFLERGIPKDRIWVDYERRMACAVGKCGHCKVGAHYMCLDGPVFTYEEMLQLPEEF